MARESMVFGGTGAVGKCSVVTRIGLEGSQETNTPGKTSGNKSDGTQIDSWLHHTQLSDLLRFLNNDTTIDVDI